MKIIAFLRAWKFTIRNGFFIPSSVSSVLRLLLMYTQDISIAIGPLTQSMASRAVIKWTYFYYHYFHMSSVKTSPLLPFNFTFQQSIETHCSIPFHWPRHSIGGAHSKLTTDMTFSTQVYKNRKSANGAPTLWRSPGDFIKKPQIGFYFRLRGSMNVKLISRNKNLKIQASRWDRFLGPSEMRGNALELYPVFDYSCLRNSFGQMCSIPHCIKR